MATVSTLTEEEKNFTRFFLLNFKVSPEIVRRFFDTVFPPIQLTQTLNSSTQTIINLSNRGPINATQLTILRGVPGTVWPSYLPTLHTGATATSSKDFDLTLMICLLRNLGAVASPLNGWDQLPQPTELSPGAHLATLKWFRNKMAHTTVSSMDNNEYIDTWNRVEKALTSLNNAQKPREVNDILKLDLNGDIAKSIAETESTHLKQKYMECENEKQQIQSNFSHYRDGDLPKYVAEKNAKLVETWQREDENFYETRGTQLIYNTVQDFKSNCIVISSGSGSGKTAVIRHIALILQSEGFQILSVKSPDEIIDYQTNEKQVFLFDDVLGKCDLTPNLLQKWETKNEKLISCLEKKLGSKKILCTLRNQVAFNKRFKSASTILNKIVINLEDMSIAPSKQEKRAILLKHLENIPEKEIQEEEIEKMCEANFAFPLLCKLISIDNERFRKRIVFFRQPISLFREELDKMYSANKKLYCSLVLCMLFNGTLNRTILDADLTKHDDKIYRILETCEIDRNMSKTELYSSACSAEGTFFTNDGNKFKFIHDTLAETVGYHFCRLYPKVMYRECDILFIRDRVTFHCTESVEQNIVTIQEEELDQANLKPLYGRLLNELKGGHFSNVLMSQLLKKKDFVLSFTTVIDNSLTTSIRKLLKTESSETLDTTDIDKVDGYQLDLKKKLEIMFFSNKTFLDKNDAVSRVIGAIGPRSTLMHWIVAFGCSELFEVAWDKLKISERKSFLGKDYLLLWNVKSFFPLAVLGGSVDIVSKLISNGADVNCFSEFWETPLYLAAKSEKNEIVQLLVTNGATVNLRGWFGMQVPIFISAHKPNLMRMLLEYDLQQTDLHIAILNNNLENLSLIIRSSNVNAKTKSGWTPLHYAVSLKHKEALTSLIGKVVPRHDDSVDAEPERKLLNKTPKPNINISDNNGLTAIHLAVINNDVETLNLLLSNKADVMLRDQHGRTALHYINSPIATKALLDYNNNVFDSDLEEGKDKKYSNDITSAFRNIFCNITLLTIFRVLFRNFINMPDKEGNTPLHLVTTNQISNPDRDDIITLLLQNGADPCLYNDKNNTPFGFIKNDCENVKCLNEQNQSTKNTAGKVLTFILLFFIALSTVLPIIFSVLANDKDKDVLCYTDQLEHFNISGNINLVQARNIIPNMILTVVLFGFLSITMINSVFLMRFKIFLILILGCILVLSAWPFVGIMNVYIFMLRAVFIVTLCTPYIQTMCCYFSVSLIHLSCFEFFGVAELPIAMFALLGWLSMHVFHFDVIGNFNEILINFPNCSALILTNVTCVGLGYNETFENGTDFSVICYTGFDTTEYSGTLTVESDIFWPDIFYLSFFYLNFSFHAVCVYFFLHYIILKSPKKYLRRLIMFVPPLVYFIITVPSLLL